ncbi:hypothetical protein R3I93_015216 [Phoxinus phoxinus]|uniref:Uncharacterized protein n=1 Tax=Phoxinus phoxinus TaxID=58324 RepID=A0AAN9H1H1_9TELE
MCLHVLLRARGCGGGIERRERLEERTRSLSDKVRSACICRCLGAIEGNNENNSVWDSQALADGCVRCS